jgi:hypothetical protein
MAVATLTTKRRVWTDAALEALPQNGHKHELLDGELIMSPVHANHGTICVRMVILLCEFVRERKLGEI